MSKIGEVIHGLSKTSLCNVWYHILDRCYNSKSPQFTDYGGRGIKVSKKWKDSPIHFVNWAKKNGYKKGLEIDRKNNDGNYEPSNCRFVTREVNSLNKRLIQTNNKSGFRGVSKHNNGKSFVANVNYKGIRNYLGFFSTAKEAAKIRDRFIIENDMSLPLNFSV